MKILCCGDSHTKVFEYCNQKTRRFLFDICIVEGATAQGAVNPNSKTDALKIFTNKIANTKSDKLLIMLGEVDCGFVIWVRSKRYNISVNEQITTSINNLFTFLDNIVIKSKYKNEDIIITGANLPTIKDSTDKKILNGARSEVDISQSERTKKTLEYNQLLQNKCEKNGYIYIEITKEIMGEDGIIKEEYLSSNPSDHHLDKTKACDLWLSKITNLYM